jgi:hypothetical protein
MLLITQQRPWQCSMGYPQKVQLYGDWDDRGGRQLVDDREAALGVAEEDFGPVVAVVSPGSGVGVADEGVAAVSPEASDRVVG